MGSVPIPRTFQGGEIEVASYLNSISAVLNFIENPPRCSVWMQTTAAVLTTGVAAVIGWDGELYDTDNMHSPTVNNSRITANTPGLYHCIGAYNFGTNATGTRQIALLKNGVTQGYEAEAAFSGSALLNMSKDIYLAAGDYLELQCQQSSGGSITAPLGQQYHFLQARWVAVS